MTAIRPERLGADRAVPEKTGPGASAPSRRSPEKLNDVDQAAAPLSRAKSVNSSGAPVHSCAATARRGVAGT